MSHGIEGDELLGIVRSSETGQGDAWRHLDRVQYSAMVSAWPLPPPPEPLAIRACLTPDVAAELDAEWSIALDQAKQSKDLAPVHALLAKWRHFAYAELKRPRQLLPAAGHGGAHAGDRPGPRWQRVGR